MCLYQKFISTFTDTLIIAPDCFLVFWFSIKGNQVYYTWITYTPALLVSFQLLFSHCVKYVEARAFSDPYLFPYVGRIVSVFSSIWTVQIRENADMILSICAKIGIRESLHFGISRVVSCWTFSVITSTYAKI